jgi:hypothetical protein
MNNVGNSGSGNIGVNNAAGNFNQQKNNLAIAVSGGRSKPLPLPTKALPACKSATTALRPTKDTLTGTVAAVGVFGAVGKLPSKVTATAVAVMAMTTEAMAAMAVAKIKKLPSKLWVPSAWQV